MSMIEMVVDLVLLFIFVGMFWCLGVFWFSVLVMIFVVFGLLVFLVLMLCNSLNCYDLVELMISVVMVENYIKFFGDVFY